jgi:recombination protein RecT
MMATGLQKPNGQTPARRDVWDAIDTVRSQLAALLPEGADAERAIAIARAACKADPKLNGCDQRSVLVSVAQACSIGLDIGKPRQHAHLVPFGQECTLIIDFRGYLELMRRSGYFEEIETRLVYEQDQFSLRYTPRLEFVHVPCLGNDPGKITHVYSYAALKSGGISFEVMTAEQVEEVRRKSKNGNGSTWRDHWPEMARKTVIRRHQKRLPQTVEMSRTLDLDNESDGLTVTASQSAASPRLSTAASVLGKLTGPAPDTQHEAAAADDAADDAPRTREPGED